MSEQLSSTERTEIDLVAMRAWHFRASLDRERAPDMRKWHRSQMDWITQRLYGERHAQRTMLKVALIEVLADGFRTQLHERMRARRPWEWSELCAAAKKAIRKRKFEGQSVDE